MSKNELQSEFGTDLVNSFDMTVGTLEQGLDRPGPITHVRSEYSYCYSDRTILFKLSESAVAIGPVPIAFIFQNFDWVSHFQSCRQHAWRLLHPLSLQSACKLCLSKQSLQQPELERSGATMFTKVAKVCASVLTWNQYGKTSPLFLCLSLSSF